MSLLNALNNNSYSSINLAIAFIYGLAFFKVYPFLNVVILTNKYQTSQQKIIGGTLPFNMVFHFRFKF